MIQQNWMILVMSSLALNLVAEICSYLLNMGSLESQPCCFLKFQWAIGHLILKANPSVCS